MSKGFAWIPVAIGIIFLVQILIFSLSFTKITIFSREVLDSNIIFEGDELETYARSIDNSVQLSIAQSLYDFFKAHENEVWQNYAQKSVPEPTQELKKKASDYMNLFLQAHASFPGAKDIPAVAFPSSIGEGTLTIKDDRIDMFFEPEVELKKTFVGVAQYSRKFVAESTLVTVFGEMMDSIRQMIGSDLIGQYAIWGIGNTGAEVKKPDACEVPNRYKTTERHSYIDEDTGCTTTNGGDPGDASCFKTGQTTTKGAMVYCSSQEDEKLCSPEDFNPCPPPETWSDPLDEEVYTHSHSGQDYLSARSIIKGYSYQQLLCLESTLDHDSEDYTVAFDGDNKPGTLEPPSIKTDAKVDGSCVYKPTGNRCGGKILDEICFVDKTKNIIYYYWQCYQEKKAVCDYKHYVEADVTVRVQEDGFVYAWADKVADSIKIIFKAISGNMQGVSIPPTGLPFGAPGTGSGPGSQPQQPT